MVIKDQINLESDRNDSLSTKNVRVLVAIVTYNGENDIKKCLHSIVSKKFQIDVFVLDNKSTDKTISILNGYAGKIKIHHSDENLGFGQANNIMLAYSLKHNYDFTFLINQDTYFIQDGLDICIENSMKDLSFAIFSPIHLSADEVNMDAAFERYITKDQHKGQPITFINAAAWLIPRKVLQTIGGFSPLFFHYGEDRDYANRLSYNNGNFRVVPDAQIVHNREARTMDTIRIKNLENYIKRAKIYLLCFAGDINNSIIIAILKTIKIGLGEAKKQIVKGNFSVAFEHLKNIIKVLSQINKIRRHRKTAHKETAFL